MNKLTVDSGVLDERELSQVKKEQDKINSILVEIGYIESKKHVLLHELADTNDIVNTTKKELEKKYGSINVDLSNGKWKRLENKQDV